MAEIFEGESEKLEYYELEALARDDVGQTAHVIKHYVVLGVIAAFWIWACVMWWTPTKNSASLKAHFWLNNNFPVESLSNHHWLTETFNPGKDHSVRVALFLWLLWTIPGATFIVTYVTNWLIVGSKVVVGREKGLRLWFEVQALEPYSIGFPVSFELGFAMALTIIEFTIPIIAGQTNIMSLLWSVGLCSAVNFGSLMIEAQSVHIVHAERTYFQSRFIAFAILPAFGFIVYALLFALEWTVILDWVFHVNSKSTFYTMTLVIGIFTFVVRLILGIMQAVFYGHIMSRVWYGWEDAEDGVWGSWMTNPYIYHIVRGIMICAIPILFTIYIGVQVNGHECLPDWDFCHL